MKREYDGLTGEEILELFMISIRESLAKEGRLSQSQVYHNVVLSGDLEITSYPHEPEVEKFTVKAAVGSEVPVGAKNTKAKVSFKEEHPIPDLARDLIKENKSGK